ncbi:response regulator receiver domain-containing protein [Motilibacter rhizosphaerae]|uniref:Response regulator receiver domain-containing protein n=1 Tax=Motilibacter rhizosphaerae TaxID=598652 RepID=A0A4Q7NVV7_9ACTN|nr:response regulator [Motilibacter rhizosphaerae]RZS91018.1 response regulator receiver domain-containing protein [Motilibacter rhizosphaerae]
MARVLVVDDDDDIRGLVSMRLKAAGHRVVAVGDGNEALALVEERGMPEVAVLDVSMPGMDGFELLQALRELGGEDVRCVFLSARVQEADVARGREVGATYLTKPFVASALINAVERSGGAAEDSW